MTNSRDDAWPRDEKAATRSDSVRLALRKGGEPVMELKP